MGNTSIFLYAGCPFSKGIACGPYLRRSRAENFLLSTSTSWFVVISAPLPANAFSDSSLTNLVSFCPRACAVGGLNVCLVCVWCFLPDVQV